MAAAASPTPAVTPIATYTCAVCEQPYTQPRVLPCMHVFCGRCITEMVVRRLPSVMVGCGSCAEEHELTGQTNEQLLAGLPIAYGHANAAALAQLTCASDAGRTAAQNYTCGFDDDHADVPATARCLACAEFLCAGCASQHQRQKTTKGHPLVGVPRPAQLAAAADAPAAGGAGAALTAAMLGGRPTCVAHAGEPLDMVCVAPACGGGTTVLCLKCALISHNGSPHALKTVELQAQAVRQEVDTMTAAAFAAVRALEALQGRIDAATGAVTAAEARARGQLSTTFAIARDSLGAREGELAALIAKHARSKIKTLSLHRDAAGVVMGHLRAACAFGSTTAAASSEPEICLAAGVLRARLAGLQAETAVELAQPAVDTALAVSGLDMRRLDAAIAAMGVVTHTTASVELHTVKRFKTAGARASWGYSSGTADAIHFEVDNDIDLVGVLVYGSHLHSPVEVRISTANGATKAASDRYLARAEGALSSSAASGTELRFPAAVRIVARTLYVLEQHIVKCELANSHFGEQGTAKPATPGGVQFTFSNAPGEPNGTCVERGQLPGVIFRLPSA
jgi:hypothetical protein